MKKRYVEIEIPDELDDIKISKDIDISLEIDDNSPEIVDIALD